MMKRRDNARNARNIPRMRKRDRLKRLNRRLREKVSRYRLLFFTSSAVAVVLAVVLVGFVAFDEPEAVTLGVGPAGVRGLDTTLAAQAVPDTAVTPAVPQAEPEAAPEEPPASAPETERGRAITGGEASYYAEELAGRPTASGEAFNPQGLTAAHRTLPLGSRVRVTNLRTGQSVVVRINDRGPFSGRRVIDLSREAARQIGMLASGTAQVQLELIPS